LFKISRVTLGRQQAVNRRSNRIGFERQTGKITRAALGSTATVYGLLQLGGVTMRPAHELRGTSSKEKLMYRVGFPGWKLAARWNIPLVLVVNVVRDEEAGVYIATSPDLKGLVVESKSQENLMRDVYDCVDMLMETLLRKPLRHRPAAAWTGEFLSA
jgi:hypothetical protein